MAGFLVPRRHWQNLPRAPLCSKAAHPHGMQLRNTRTTIAPKDVVKPALA